MIDNPDTTRNLHIHPNRTFICSVIFIDICGYTKKSFNEQILIKERFNIHLAEAIKCIALNDRIVLDTGDGAAVGCIGDPADALAVAMNMRKAFMSDDSGIAPGLMVRIGINLGPVRILKDINNQMNMIGDGINVAERIMSFSEPGQLLISRSYYDMLSCLSQEYADLFHYQGSRTDKHVREHDVYAVEYNGTKMDSAEGAPYIKCPSPNGADIASLGETEPIRRQNVLVKGRNTHRTLRVFRMLMAGTLAISTIAALIVLFFEFTMPPAIIKMVRDTGQIFITLTEEPLKTAAKGMPTLSPDTPDFWPEPDQGEADAMVISSETQLTQTAIPGAGGTSILPSLSAPHSPEKTRMELFSSPATDVETIPPSVQLKRQETPDRKTFKAVSSKAGDILFTVTGMRSQGNEVTVRIQTYNDSNTSKRLAFYDGAYWWTKSQITDGTGKRHDVNKVRFTSEGEEIAMSLTGTQGVPIAPQKTVTAYMTFKKTRKGVKTLVLHPFIYHGEHKSEHNLVMKLGG
jgi:hypothetical protein